MRMREEGSTIAVLREPPLPLFPSFLSHGLSESAVIIYLCKRHPPLNLMIRDSNIPEAMECSKPDKVCTFIISTCSRFMYTLRPQAGIWLILFYWCWNCLFNFECIMPCIPIIILACCILLYKRTAHAGRTPSTVTDQLPLSRSADRVRLQSPSLSKKEKLAYLLYGGGAG